MNLELVMILKLSLSDSSEDMYVLKLIVHGIYNSAIITIITSRITRI